MTVRLLAWGILFVDLVFMAQQSARAQGAPWKSVAGWDIVRAGSGDNAFCMASAHYRDGTTVFIYVVPGPRQLRMSLAHERWKSVENGREYPVVISFDGIRSSGIMYGDVFGPNQHGVMANLTRAGVVRFMAANTMSVTYKGEHVAKLNLSGTQNGHNQMD